MKCKPPTSLTQQQNSNTLGCYSFKTKPSVWLIFIKSILTYNKELRLCRHLVKLFKLLSLIAQNRAGRQTQTQEDLEEQNPGPRA